MHNKVCIGAPNFYTVTDEVQDQYVRIIDGILAVSDLNTISKSRIQRGIQEAVNYDITPHKAAIKELIFERFDEFHARQEESPAAVDAASDAASDAAGDAAGEATVEPKTEPSPDPPTNGHAVSSSSSSSPVKRQSGSDGISEIVEEPSKKKRKEENLDADAEMAARLQAEENARVRSTRGARTRKSAPAKKRAIKKKTSRKVKGSDDSDIESSDVTDKPERNTGFHVSSRAMHLIYKVLMLRRNLYSSHLLYLHCLTVKFKCPDHRQSSAFGLTSRQTICKTRKTSVRSSVTRE